MTILGRLLATFAAGVMGFFGLFGLLLIGLAWLALGALSFIFLIAALFSTGAWWLGGGGSIGRTALIYWGLAAGFFAMTPVILTVKEMLKERRQAAALGRISTLRLERP